MRIDNIGKMTGKVIVIFNLLTVRLDALLSNFIDFSFIALYTLVTYSYMGSLSLPSGETIRQVILASLSSHCLYSLAYIVNDFIDYGDVKRHQNDPNLYSLYKYRPVVYFDRSKSIITYLACIYSLYLFGVLKAFFYIRYLLTIIVPLLFTQSIVHSLCKGSAKALSFLALRLVKYMLFLTMLSMFMGFLDKALTITIALPLIIPYVAFVSLSYVKQKSLIKSERDTKIDDAFISLMLMLLMLLPIYAFYLSGILNRSPFFVMSSIIFGYLVVVLPFFGVRMVLRRSYGSKNIDFHDHVKRLLAGAFLITAMVTCELVALAFLF